MPRSNPGSQASGEGAQSSFYSSLSGSGVEIRIGHEDDLLEERAFGHGAMGVMYTVCKEKVSYSNVFIAFRLLADWLQLWLLVVQPPQFSLPPDKLWWQVISVISLNQFMAARGYQFFLACFYLLVAGLLLSVGLCVWVGYSFQQNRFDHVWPIVVLRWFAKIFYQILDIMSLSLFLMVLDCQTFSRSADIIGYNQEFPDVYCWTMPHLIHVFVAVISLVIFVVLAGAFTVGEMELDFTTRNQMAIMHTEKELWTFGIRVLMTFVNVFIYSPKWASIVQLGLSCWLTYLIWYWQPQLEGWVNHTRTGMYASVAWCSLLYTISAFNIGWDASDPSQDATHIKQLTGLMWGLTIPIGCLGALASWLRLRFFEKMILTKFKQPIPENTLDLHKFTDSRFVEVLARCCRVWVNSVTLDADAVQLGEAVIKVGITQMPKDPFMMILHSSFLMDVQSSYQSGYAQLQAAKKLDNSFLMRFAIFSREQQHAQRSAAGSLGNRAADLVSYVEFQRNYGMVLKVHRDTLTNIQRFWHSLMHKTVRFRTLAESVQAMDVSIKQAERVYKQVLQRHATSVKIVRLYAKFLEHVKQDPWAAARWFSEAERLAVLEEEMKHTDALEGVELDDPALKAALIQSGGPKEPGSSQDERAVIILNAQSVIVITNDAVLPLFGYTKSELKGKSLRMVLPPQVAEFHVTYVRNFIQTGRTAVLNNTTDHVALHKDKRLVPIRLTVHKISGIGEDTQFMGIVEPIKTPPNEASLWLRADGTIMLADATFEDWFGYNAKEMQGMSFATLTISGSKHIEGALKKAVGIAAAEYKRRLQQNMKDKKAARDSSATNLHETASAPSAEKLPSAFNVSEVKSMGSQVMMEFEDVDMEMECNLTVAGIGLAHKYGNPMSVDIEIRNAGVGATRYQVLTLRRTDGSIPLATRHSLHSNGSMQRGSWNALPIMNVPQDLMLVTNAKGQVCHISGGLADMLGRTRQQAMANSANYIVESLMVRPFGHLHRALLQGIQPTVSPAFSCRSGLSVLMQGSSVQGQQLVQPFSMNISKKAMGEDKYHVAVLQQRTMQQAMDERRLLLQLDDQATVTQVLSQSPLSLFGCDPEKLVGKHAGSFLDVLRSPISSPSAELDSGDKQRALEVFLDMASTALNASSSTWRVGFIPPEAYQGSEAVPNAKIKSMLSAKAKPTLMRIRAIMPELMGNIGAEEPAAVDHDTENNAVTAVISGGITFEVELWRADLCTSIIELDGDGNVLVPETPELSELYPPDLVLGLAPESMIDQHVGVLLPALATRSLHELFTAGAFAPLGAVTAAAARGSMKRSAMKSVQPAAPSLAGPIHNLGLKHHGDKSDLQISIQAVRKTGTSRGMFLVVHPVKPTSGRPDFATWIAEQARARTPNALSRRVSRAGFNMQPALRLSHLRARLSQEKHAPALPGVVEPAVLPNDDGTFDQADEDIAQAVQDSAQAFALQESGSSKGEELLSSQRDSNSNRLSARIPTPPPGPKGRAGSANNQDQDAIKAVWGANGEDPEGGRPDEDVSSDVSDNEHDENSSTQLDIADDAAAQADVVDEGDYKRGQRFKRLYAMLSSVIVQRPVEVYRKRAYLLTAIAITLQVAAFVIMLMLLKQLSTMVNNLTYIGNAGQYGSEVAVKSRTLQMMYSGMVSSNLRHMASLDDIPYAKAALQTSIKNFLAMHSQVYLHSGAMPTAFGLRDLWDKLAFNVTETTSIPGSQYEGNFTIDHQVRINSTAGLWKAGVLLSSRAQAFLNGIDKWNASINGDPNLMANHTDLMWIIDNAPNVIFPAYLQCLDFYLQLVIQQASSTNTIQMILLLVEGLLLCAVLSCWTWFNLQQVAKLRFTIYNTFMSIPSGLVRRLATRKFVLGDEEGNEDEQEDTKAIAGPGHESGSQRQQQAKSTKDQNQGQSKVNFMGKKDVPEQQQAETQPAVQSFWRKALTKVKSTLGLSHPGADKQDTKRTLQPCIRTTLWLLWPFLLWGAMVILGNSIGYVLLSQIPGPVAMFNAVNYVKMMYNDNNFYIQELIVNSDPVMQRIAQNRAATRIADLRKQYYLMMYGSSFTPGETSPHYTLVTKGVVHANPEGDRLMFETTDCLAVDPSDCALPTDSWYADTRNGMDRMFSRYLAIGRAIPYFTGLDPYMNGPEYTYYFNTRPDIKGGLSQLTAVFQGFVVTNLQSVQILHIVIFVLTLVLYGCFIMLMLRPFLNSVHNETQRIAELLSQLPPEVDVTSMVMKTLLPPEPDTIGGWDLQQAAIEGSQPTSSHASNNKHTGGNDEERASHGG